MKNLIFISAFTFLFNWTATAAGHISRDSSWTYGGNGGLNLSQVSLSNWASGGENAVGFDVAKPDRNGLWLESNGNKRNEKNE